MKGFTLVEVLISIFLFAITAVGVGAALSQGLVLIHDARDLTLAQAALQEELAVLRTTTDPSDHSPRENAPFIGEIDALTDIQGEGRLTIAPLKNSKLLEVNVSVHWMDRSHQETSVAVSTLLGGANAP